MRAPRYRFPDEVRSATRAMASRMVQQGTVANTPEQLDLWISENPDVGEVLEKGGYSRAFDASDLLPLLQVFAVQARGPAPEAEAPPAAPSRKWLVAAVLGVILLGITIAVILLR